MLNMVKGLRLCNGCGFIAVLIVHILPCHAEAMLLLHHSMDLLDLDKVEVEEEILQKH